MPSIRSVFSVMVFFSFSCFCFSALAQSNIDHGIQLYKNNDLIKAESFFKDYLKSDKKHAGANYWIARIYFDNEDFGKAADFFEKAAEYDEGNSHYHMWLGHSYGRAAQNASVFKQPGLARRCRSNYEKAVELDPANTEARESAMEFYLQAPGFMGGGRDKAEAEATAISKYDAIAGASAQARIHNYYEETDQAIAIYQKIIEQHPAEMTPYYGLFNIYFAEQEFEKASEVARKQLSLNDTTASIYLNFGNALQRFNKFEEAYGAYQRGLEIDSTLSNFWYQMGRLAGESGSHLEEGKRYIQKYINYPGLGDGILAWSYYRLGSINEHLEDLEDAKQAYRLALEKDDNHELAKAALDRLN